ncbi:MAG: hypothetical protein JWQ74_3495 [Marmoricola sp.]|nr:hypothetical protein [Marmoricola sp.]
MMASLFRTASARLVRSFCTSDIRPHSSDYSNNFVQVISAGWARPLNTASGSGILVMVRRSFARKRRQGRQQNTFVVRRFYPFQGRSRGDIVEFMMTKADPR